MDRFAAVFNDVNDFGKEIFIIDSNIIDQRDSGSVVFLWILQNF